MNYNLLQQKNYFLSFFLCLFCFLPTIPVNALSTSADSVILMEQESGRVLYEHNAQEEKLIASITKLLTALIAIESQLPLEDFVEITAESCYVEGSSLYLKEGDKMTLEALLYGMLLHSGNDAATAIAIHCAGSVEDFVSLMNEKAEQLGMKHSAFANPHGLNDTNHYSSAYDMALVAQACLDYEILAKMVETQRITLCGRTFVNKNKLLSMYEGCIGMKTGYTELAGRTLVSAATRDGMTLICVTLDAPDDWDDHSKLFDYGFETYQMKEFTAETMPTIEIPVENSLLPFVTIGVEETFRYPVTKEEEISFQFSVPAQMVQAPIEVGTEAKGEIIWTLGEEELSRFPLFYQESVENNLFTPKTWWDKLTDFLGKT